MATLALGVAGAVVGSFFGPLGTSLGWGIGAAIGGRLFGKAQHGPRITDLRAQVSAYGQPIPIGYGTIRVAGNVIWADDIQEHKEKKSGKGGPKVVEYTYSQSFAVSLLETTFINGAGTLTTNAIVGILRIWADGRLIYGEGSDGTSLPMTIYYGTETQAADPTMESVEGAGNVSAHRGLAYVVFADLPLGGFGNRIPNLTFEVIASGAIDLEYKYRWWVDYDYPSDSSTYSYPSILNGIERTTAGLVLHRYRSGNDYGTIMGTADDNKLYYDRRIYDVSGAAVGSPDARITLTFDTAHLSVYGSLNSGIAYAFWIQEIDCGSGVQSFSTFAWVKNGVVTYTPPDLCAIGDLTRNLPIQASPVYWNGWLFAAGRYPGQDMILRRWPAPDGSCYVEDFDPTVSFNADVHRTGYPTSIEIADSGDIIVGDDGYLYWLVGYYAGADDGTRLFKLDQELNLIDSWWSDGGARLPTAGYGSTTIYRGSIIGQHNSGEFLLGPCFVMDRLNSNGTTTFVAEITRSLITPVHYIGGGLAAVRDGILQLATSGITLGQIVSNVSEHVGYSVSTEINVTALTDVVRGYTIGNRMTGRDAIEALQPCYQFGAVESNLAVKFVKWGGEVAETVTADELAARDESSSPGDPLAITYVDDKQLPQRIEAVYINLGMDYQEGMQYIARTESYSDLQVPVQFPVVLTDAEAKQRVDVLGINAWAERKKYRFALPRKYAHWEPTDVHNVNGHAVRLTNKQEIGYTHIEFEGIATKVGTFIAGPVAAEPIGFVPQTPPTLNKTDLLLLDLPMTSDTDPQIVTKAAIAGRMDGPWPGMALFKSIDGGVNYESIYSTVERDTFGVATTVLGNFTSGHIFDEINSVTVRLTPGSGELASSNELGVLNGANTAALGAEIIQFRTATLTATRTYKLTGLLRGLRGTEWAMGSHALDDDFVLLPCHNIEAQIMELWQGRSYKGVTTGGTLASVTAQSFTNTGISLNPYPPVLLGGGRDGSSNITFNWTRRTRIGGAWLDRVDVPLSEDEEFYVVTVYSSSSYATIKREISAGTPTASYSAAEQTTDFGAAQSTIYWDVAQFGRNGFGRAQRGVT